MSRDHPDVTTTVEQPEELHDHDRGLAFDLAIMNRRKALLWAVGGAASLALAACGSNDATTSGTTTDATTTGATGTNVGEIAEETGGPYPGDGSNGPNVLAQSGVVRRDITSSFGSLSGSVTGVPVTIDLRLLDIAKGGTPAAGAAVYLWHCDRDGNYSLYSQGVTDQNWLRGVQEADADGKLTFTSIFPGCYPGRWPHIHFEVYPSVSAATAAGSKLHTSQIALPKDACELAYASDGYGASVTNLSQLSLETDNVFSDGVSTQLATVTGTPTAGMVIALNVGV